MINLLLVQFALFLASPIAMILRVLVIQRQITRDPFILLLQVLLETLIFIVTHRTLLIRKI